MKALFNLIIVALAVVAGWYAQPGLVKSLDTNRERAKKQRDEEIANAVKQATGGKQLAGSTGNDSSSGPVSNLSPAAAAARQLSDSIRKNGPAPSSLPDLSSGKSPGGMNQSPSTPVVAQVDEFEAKYPLPVFKEITEITKEWSSIPSRAFPRTVKTLVPINLEGPAGKVPLPEQSNALAVGMTQGMLVLMKSREEPARSLVPLANTDLKETLTTLYDKYKAYKIDQVMKQRERARGLKARANGATDSELASVGPKPKMEPGGIIPVMLASLRAKEITETTEDRITAWGGLNIEQINGKSYWTGTIQCTVDNAIFGPTPTELMALIRDDKVVKWLYSGSKEEVQ